MSHASIPALDQSAEAGAGPAAISARKARRAEARNASDRAFLEHYFRRLDPEVAASFSAEQRDAMATMFGARGIARHAVEVRRSVPFPGGRRLYLVFLLGRERRAISPPLQPGHGLQALQRRVLSRAGGAVPAPGSDPAYRRRTVENARPTAVK